MDWRWRLGPGIMAVVLAVATFLPAAVAQGGLDPTAPPGFGEAILEAGFSPDPHVVRLSSGGTVNVRAALGDACLGEAQGYAATAPDYRVKYAGGPEETLRFFFLGEGDTTLVIYSPDRRWYCDDDSWGQQNPQITFAEPRRGWYNIWVGSYNPGDTVAGMLSITAQGQDSVGTPARSRLLNPQDIPIYGATALGAGFAPDPHTVSMASGGGVDVRADLGTACAGDAQGYVASAPGYRVQYTAGAGGRLRFFFRADGDTTLVIYGPDGRWTCDDDSGGDRNPLITFENPLGGAYSIWVGSYHRGEVVNGQLFITGRDLTPGNLPGGTTAIGPGLTGTPTPTPPPLVIGGFDLAATPSFGTAILAADFLPDPYQVRLMSGGGVDVRANLANSCVGEAQGYAASAPDVRVQYTAGTAGRLRFFFVGDGDTTLVVRSPDGKWTCDDDSAGTQNPMITFVGPASGQYDVWVGSFTQGDFVLGVLYLTEQDLTPGDYR